MTAPIEDFVARHATARVDVEALLSQPEVQRELEQIGISASELREAAPQQLSAQGVIDLLAGRDAFQRQRALRVIGVWFDRLGATRTTDALAEPAAVSALRVPSSWVDASYDADALISIPSKYQLPELFSYITADTVRRLREESAFREIRGADGSSPDPDAVPTAPFMQLHHYLEPWSFLGHAGPSQWVLNTTGPLGDAAWNVEPVIERAKESDNWEERVADARAAVREQIELGFRTWATTLAFMDPAHAEQIEATIDQMAAHMIEAWGLDDSDAPYAAVGAEGALGSYYQGIDALREGGNHFAWMMQNLGPFVANSATSSFGPRGILGPGGVLGTHPYRSDEQGRFYSVEDGTEVVHREVAVDFDGHGNRVWLPLSEHYTEAFAKELGAANDTSWWVEGNLTWETSWGWWGPTFAWETDAYTFTSPEDQLVEIKLIPVVPGSVNLDFELLDDQGEVILESSSRDMVDFAQVMLPAGQTFTVRVNASSFDTAASLVGHEYRLSVQGAGRTWSRTELRGEQPHIERGPS